MPHLIEDSHATRTDDRVVESVEPDRKCGKKTITVPEAANDLYMEWRHRTWEQIARHAATH